MKSYRIEKISDFFQVPVDRREACVRDLLYGLALHELAFGELAAKSFHLMDWTDDDDHSCNLYSPSGATILSLEIKKDAP